jgi:hypothetical protein
MRARNLVGSVLLISLGAGCATGNVSGSLLGRSVTVVPQPGSDAGGVQGELIAVEPERIWVLGKERVVEVPMASIKELRLRRHGLTTRRGWTWTAVGALVTGTALAMACSSYDHSDGCAKVFVAVGLPWLALGGLPAMGLDNSATIRLIEPRPEALQRYARFPQGPPEGVDLRSLTPKPAR